MSSMTRDILSVIQNSMPTFSKGQRLIARFILESYDKAAFMTASKLGKTVNVSESTVVRFAAELGYDGYPSMQKALQEMIRNKLTSIQRIEVANDRILPHRRAADPQLPAHGLTGEIGPAAGAEKRENFIL